MDRDNSAGACGPSMENVCSVLSQVHEVTDKLWSHCETRTFRNHLVHRVLAALDHRGNDRHGNGDFGDYQECKLSAGGAGGSRL